MDEAEYQDGLERLRNEWGELVVDSHRPGVLQATRDPTTGLVVGFRAKLIADGLTPGEVRALRAAERPLGRPSRVRHLHRDTPARVKNSLVDKGLVARRTRFAHPLTAQGRIVSAVLRCWAMDGES